MSECPECKSALRVVLIETKEVKINIRECASQGNKHFFEVVGG
jgi:Zn ribbon nucleic-acid-binding protein